MAGLQDIAPMVAKRWVTRAVLAPIRAAALAASQPAWPPPMTMTSKESAGKSCGTSIAELINPKAKFEGTLFHVKHGFRQEGPCFT